MVDPKLVIQYLNSIDKSEIVKLLNNFGLRGTEKQVELFKRFSEKAKEVNGEICTEYYDKYYQKLNLFDRDTDSYQTYARERLNRFIHANIFKEVVMKNPNTKRKRKYICLSDDIIRAITSDNDTK